MHHFSARGGIVARAVLIDYVSYAEKHGIKYSPTTRHEITVKDVEAIAKEQGVEFKPADILVIRRLVAGTLSLFPLFWISRNT